MPLSDRLKRFGLGSSPAENLDTESKPKSKSPSRSKLRIFRSEDGNDVPKAAASDHPAQGVPEAGKQKPQLQPTDNLWLRAEADLKNDPLKKEMFIDYLEILGQQLDSKLMPENDDERHKQFCKLVDIRTRELEDKKYKVQVGDYTREIGDLFQRSLKAILSVKDLINTAASSCPPASLALCRSNSDLDREWPPMRSLKISRCNQVYLLVNRFSSPPRTKSLPLLKACIPLLH